MPQHIRHANGEANSQRTVLKFPRKDLLRVATLTSSTGKKVEVPIQDGNKMVGPTVLDLIWRQGVEPKDLPPKLRKQVADPEQLAYVWSLRPEATLFAPKPDRSKAHPFKPSLVSGGEHVADKDGFMLVEKLTTISISDVAFKLAVGMMGGVAEAYSWITGLAAAAWEKDLERSLALFRLLERHPAGVLEDEKIEALRPVSSVSEAIEYTILRQACVWLGVDPDMDCARPKGRPRKQAQNDETERGNYIAITIVDGKLHGKLILEFMGFPLGQDLAALGVVKLAEMLGALRSTKDAGFDADLLEAYLDATSPAWRERIGGEESAASSIESDPYTILGVTPDMKFEEITTIYRRTMQKIHPDTTSLPPLFAAMVSGAYRKIKEMRK